MAKRLRVPKEVREELGRWLDEYSASLDRSLERAVEEIESEDARKATGREAATYVSLDAHNRKYGEHFILGGIRRRTADPSRSGSMTTKPGKSKGVFGARVFLMGADTALIVQTRKSGTGQNDRFVIDQKPDGAGERFVALDDDATLAAGVRDALRGVL